MLNIVLYLSNRILLISESFSRAMYYTFLSVIRWMADIHLNKYIEQ